PGGSHPLRTFVPLAPGLSGKNSFDSPSSRLPCTSGPTVPVLEFSILGDPG
ncbi:hypothetical protein KI387_001878, partial [Taxus chinensis]